MPVSVTRRRLVAASVALATCPVFAQAQEETPAVPPPAPAAPVVTPAIVPGLPSGANLTASAARPAAQAGIDRTKIYVVFFSQAIDLASMRGLRRQLAALVEAGVSEIDVVIDSGGGSVEQALITYSFIRALPATVNTHAQHLVLSAATLLFLAGQTRTADRDARFMFHPPQLPVSGMLTEPQLRDYVAAADAVDAAMGEIYRDRTSLTERDIDRFGHEEVFMTAEQARAAGIVQTVADLKIPGDQKARMLFLD